MTRPALAALLAALAVAGPAAAQQDSITADTTLLGHASRQARTRHAQLAGSAPDAGATLYQNVRRDLASGDWDGAMLGLSAALSRAPRSALYRGDLAYLVARAGSLDSAATLYTQAYSLQQQNGWFLVGLAVVRASQSRWPDAAGTLEVAAQADSTVVDGRFATTAVAYFTQAGDRTRALDWARVGVVKAPDDAGSWFALARAYAERDDTAGLAAARRYHALRPEEPFGRLILANQLYLVGKGDSALALAEQVAADTSYRDAVAVMYLRIGVRLMRQRELDRAVEVLGRGRALGSEPLRPNYAYYMGSAQLARLGSVLTAVEASRNCDQARAAESLVVTTSADLEAGASVDTARVRTFLNDVVPGYRRSAQGFRENFCRTPASRPPARTRPRPS